MKGTYQLCFSDEFHDKLDILQAYFLNFLVNTLLSGKLAGISSFVLKCHENIY